MNASYRLAGAGDAEAIARLFRRTRELCLPYLPTLHTPEEDFDYFSNHVLAESEVWVAESGECTIGFCAFADAWLHHLYIAPEAQRGGIGSRLLRIALSKCLVMNLWVFQQNAAAIRFYESHGFRLVKTTDGSENEERVPDALYAVTVS